MGESACWLHLTCRACDSVSDRLDADGHCPSCRAATETDTRAPTAARRDGPGSAAPAQAPADSDTTNGGTTDV